MAKKLFKEYYNRLALIGCGKSAVLSLIAAFLADFVAAIIVFATKAPLSTVLIVCLCTFAAVFAISLPIYYFSYFRPTTAMIARVVDKLGLEERIVTMCEFEKDDSYIAMIQREDAKNKLKSVNAKNLKFGISRVAAILLAISFCLGTSMTAVSVYASMLPENHGSSVSDGEDGEDGKDKDGDKDGEDENENPEEEDPTAEYVTVTYLVKDDIGGHIQGDAVQKIKKGSDAKPVKAIADEGYEFYVWSDDYIYSERYDWEVTEDLTVEAIFVPEEESGDGEGEGDENGDDAGHGNAGDKNNQGGQGGEGGQGFGKGDKGESNRKPDSSGGHGQASSGQGAGNQGQGGLGNIGGDGLGAEGGGSADEGLGAEGGDGEGEGGDANGDGQGGEGEGEGQGQGEGQGGGDGSSTGRGDGEGDGEGNGNGAVTDPENAQGGIGEGEPPLGDGELETDYVGGGDNNHNGQGGTGNVEGGGLSGESQKNNTVIDGNTSYQEGIQGESSQENLQNDQSIPPELKDLIDKYLNGLKP